MSFDHIDPSNILFLDIETVPEVYHWAELSERTRSLWAKKMRFRMEQKGLTAEALYKEAGIFAEFGRIVCICVGFIHGSPKEYHFKGKSFAGDDEVKLLEDFSRLCDDYFSDEEHYLCGHNGKEFDFPYIARRCLVNELALPRALDISGRKPWEVKHLDTLHLWKFGDYKHYTSLDLLAHVLNIPSPKSDISGEDVARVYYEENDLERIVEYCHRDVFTTAQVFLKLQGLGLIDQDHLEIVE